MQLKARNQPLSGADLDSIVESLESSLPDASDGESGGHDSTSKHRQLHSMMSHSGRIVVHGPWQTGFYGPYSGYSFVLRTLELFRRMPDSAALKSETQKVTTALFNAAVPGNDATAHYSAQFQSLPTLAITMDLLDAVFTRCQPLIQFVHEADFRDMVHRLYSESAPQFGASSHDFMPLFHSVLAVALLFDRRSRNAHGCEEIVTEA